MKEQIRQNASLEALSKKSFKKYLKMLIKDKENLLSTYEGVLHDTHEVKKKVHAEYSILCQVLDDYKYHQARRKDLKGIKSTKGFKEDSCRI